MPPSIAHQLSQITLAIDIMFINRIPFFVMTSRKLHFKTVETLPNRQTETVRSVLQRVIQLYTGQGLRITEICADGEFRGLEPLFPSIRFNLAAYDEHTPEVKRCIRTIKDRTRSAYNSLPFARIPRLILIRMVYNAVFWLNAFPHDDSMSDTLSPCLIMTGRNINYRRHVQLEFGSYVQTHAAHTNDMQARTVGAICLGPSGNTQGGHYLMSLATGRRLHRYSWTTLLMPDNVIRAVNRLGAKQHIPKSLTFADHTSFEPPDHPDDINVTCSTFRQRGRSVKDRQT